MTIVEGTTYDIFAVNGAGWLIDDRCGLTDILAVKKYAELFKKSHDPYAIYRGEKLMTYKNNYQRKQAVWREKWLKKEDKRLKQNDERR